MPIQVETFDLTQILMPAKNPEDARWDAGVWGPNLTITRGQAVAQKTADMKMYPFATGAGDGTQNFQGFAMYSFVTDANGLVFYGPNAVSGARIGPWRTSPYFRSGIFDPQEIQTAAVPAGEVDTFTPANVAIGNVFTLTATEPDGSTTVINYTAAAATAADVVAGLTALILANTTSWTFNAVTPSGAATLILTSKNPGTSFAVASSATGGTATFTRAATTAASGRAIADLTAHGAPSARILPDGFWYVP